MELQKLITASAASGSHVQGIAVDAMRQYLYISLTTCLLKTDMHGNPVGSVTGLLGHLGCIAYNYEDGKVYGSLEFKKDSIGRGILSNLGNTSILQDGFYMTVFDVDKIDRMDMDAEKDGVMTAVYLKEVFDDYSAPGHRYGCSGIDGTTFAPAMGKDDGKQYLYVAYGVYSDTSRDDNDHQVILQYDISDWDKWAQPLCQNAMHRSGPAMPTAKYFVFTGNTTYGIQNLEYDPYSHTVMAAVYPGKKEQYPKNQMYFIDCAKAPVTGPLKGMDETGQQLTLAPIGPCDEKTGLHGNHFHFHFPLGSTGIASLGNGLFYIAEPWQTDSCFGCHVRLYRFDPSTGDFALV